ncbi:hypothetical protein DL240_16940 [Lujinxingia litoralis]|uniref:DUF218 domain-containing protein n=1 Tax=Lujinxingia litoralis TaxID=2211119 RepID=A0A328C3T6_9DELT|nr:ElyC/SanA/YdcF family protein [Lujinxingia litoralis]RAL20491.1 hypothetical protein DL240_16940 [Lujinxingia litoralis]
MWMIKKTVAMLLLPLGMVAGLLMLGLALWWRWPQSRVGPLLVAAAGAGLLFASCSPGADLLLRPLEQKYPPLSDQALLAGEPPTHVVVLGAGYIEDERYPLVSQLHSEGVLRLVEGIRLVGKLPGAILVVSGGARGDGRPSAQASRELAVELGVDPARIALADRAQDTAQEARQVQELAGPGARVVVVTSASHMPRAMQLFERQGLSPIAAPTAHRVIEGRAGGLWPNATHLRKTERALYEWVGRAFVSLGGS